MNYPLQSTQRGGHLPTSTQSAGDVKLEFKEAIRAHISLPSTLFEFRFPQSWSCESHYLEQLQLSLAATHTVKNMVEELANLADYKDIVIFRKCYLLIVAGFS